MTDTPPAPKRRAARKPAAAPEAVQPTPVPAPQPVSSPGWLARHGAQVAIAVSVVALGLSVWASFGGGVETRVRTYLVENPQILDEMVQARDQQAATQRIERLNAGIAALPQVLEPGPGEPVFGPPDAAVTVVEYFDYRCPYCKTAAPGVMELMRAHPDVRFVFREWPILDAGTSTVSQHAARAALVAHSQGKYLAVHQALMAEGALSHEAIDRILAENGVDTGPDGAALNAPSVSRILADVQAGAGAVGMDGTPTFFINGRASASNAPEAIAQAIAAAR
jgi:protein-disulfide isomerase